MLKKPMYLCLGLQVPMLRTPIYLCCVTYFSFFPILWYIPRERFLDPLPEPPPPPINFVHDHLFFANLLLLIFLLFRVRLRHFLGRDTSSQTHVQN